MTIAEIEAILLQHATWINSTIVKSKLPAELANQPNITDGSESHIIQKGTEDAKEIATEVLRGYKGTWAASTNTPTLIDGTGINLDTYYVDVAGSQDLGSGSITFAIGDKVQYANNLWTRVANTASENFVTTDTNELTGLTGDKVWDGEHTFNTDILLNSSVIIDEGGASESSIQFGAGRLDIGDVAAEGTNLLLIGDGSSILLNSTGVNLSTHLLPLSTDTYDLGNDTFKWRDLYVSGNVFAPNVANKLTNVVHINSASDFPTAVANVITLEADTNYRYSGDLSIGADRFDTSAGNITIYGANPNTDKITSTTTGALFTGASVRLRNIGVTVSSGDVFDMSGLGVISLPSFFVFGCENLGTVDATGLFFWDNSNITSMSISGLLFSGVCRSIIIQNNSFSDFEGTAIDLGTATSSLLRIDSNRLAGNVGSMSIEVEPDSANITAEGEGWMINNFFNGDGAASVGTDAGDDSWVYRDNAGVTNSSRGADGYILGNAVETVISTINTPVPVNFDGSFIPDHESSFTVDTDGCFTYTGKNTVSVLGTASVFGDSAAGNNQGYRFYFAKDTGSGFVIDLGSVAQEEYDSSDPHSTSISAINVAATGDKFCLWVECITGTTNITIETASIHILGF